VPLATFATQGIQQCTFTETSQRVIEAGADTDTIASITGQIARAALGSSALPADR
jgi:ADP-ribosylglycohydrolase